MAITGSKINLMRHSVRSPTITQHSQPSGLQKPHYSFTIFFFVKNLIQKRNAVKSSCYLKGISFANVILTFIPNWTAGHSQSSVPPHLSLDVR